jgi:hypothetical protein
MVTLVNMKSNKGEAMPAASDPLYGAWRSSCMYSIRVSLLCCCVANYEEIKALMFRSGETDFTRRDAGANAPIGERL